MAGLVGQEHTEKDCPEEGVVQEHPEDQQCRQQEQVWLQPKMVPLDRRAHCPRIEILCHRTLHHIVIRARKNDFSGSTLIT
jgi:hypothetical protein